MFVSTILNSQRKSDHSDFEMHLVFNGNRIKLKIQAYCKRAWFEYDFDEMFTVKLFKNGISFVII